MSTAWEELTSATLGLPGVREERSRFADRPALLHDDHEIAHVEPDGWFDVRVGRARARELRDDPRVRPRPSGSDWVFVDPVHVQLVIELVAELVAAAAAT